MTAIDWFSLLHPVLVILFVYPVVGATIRLGILVREKRLGITKQPAPVPREHADHGRWLTAGVVVAVLIALVYSFVSKAVEPGAAFIGGASRLALLMLVAAGTLVALLALLKVKRPVLRASFTLLTWAGLLGLGSQPRSGASPMIPSAWAFWSSHYWSGVLLTRAVPDEPGCPSGNQPPSALAPPACGQQHLDHGAAGGAGDHGQS